MQKLKTILLVDDYEADNFIHQLVIDRYGCAETVDSVENGKQAMDYLTACVEEGRPLPDMIFLDINMPIMDGWEFLDAATAAGMLSEKCIVVAMLTTSRNPDDTQRAEQLGVAKTYVNKPLTRSILHKLLLEFYPHVAVDEA